MVKPIVIYPPPPSQLPWTYVIVGNKDDGDDAICEIRSGKNLVADSLYKRDAEFIVAACNKALP